MKILAINASHRGNRGHTKFLLDRLSKGVTARGAQLEVVALSKHKINPCISCGKCNSKDHYLKCIHEDKDDVRSIFDKMAAADLLIYATPIYLFTMTGLLKNFLDRMYATADVFDLKMTKSGLFFHHVDETISSKPFVTLICCDNMEKEITKNAISYFKTYAKFHDADQVGLLVRNAGRFLGHGKDPDAEKRSTRIKDAYQAFEDAGRELATTGRISASTQKRAAQDVLPIPPFIRWLKNLRPVKMKIIKFARQNTIYTEGDV